MPAWQTCMAMQNKRSHVGQPYQRILKMPSYVDNVTLVQNLDARQFVYIQHVNNASMECEPLAEASLDCSS